MQKQWTVRKSGQLEIRASDVGASADQIWESAAFLAKICHNCYALNWRPGTLWPRIHVVFSSWVTSGCCAITLGKWWMEHAFVLFLVRVGGPQHSGTMGRGKDTLKPLSCASGISPAKEPFGIPKDSHLQVFPLAANLHRLQRELLTIACPESFHSSLCQPNLRLWHTVPCSISNPEIFLIFLFSKDRFSLSLAPPNGKLGISGFGFLSLLDLCSTCEMQKIMYLWKEVAKR